MVEFALILPVLALLLVMAIDFGRVFFGTVALHNAARIGANEAATNPDAWESGDADAQDRYYDRILSDLEAINCDYATPLPDPTFTSRVGTANPYEIGDHVTVTLECEFDLITPLAGAIVGQQLTLGAEATFPIRGGVIAGVPVGPQPPPAGCLDLIAPNMVGMSVAGARSAWTSAGFTGAFNPASGFDAETVTAQTTTPPSTPGDCLVATASVLVTHEAPATCSGTDLVVPNMLGQTLADARTTWADALFTGSFSPASGFDTEVVETQVTSSADNPGECAPEDASVTVTHGTPPPPPDPQCTAPDLFRVRVNDLGPSYFDPAWTGNLIINRPPTGNYRVETQSLVAGQDYDCDIDMTVYGDE